jgi:hypothetical protein
MQTDQGTALVVAIFCKILNLYQHKSSQDLCSGTVPIMDDGVEAFQGLPPLHSIPLQLYLLSIDKYKAIVSSNSNHMVTITIMCEQADKITFLLPKFHSMGFKNLFRQC